MSGHNGDLNNYGNGGQAVPAAKMCSANFFRLIRLTIRRDSLICASDHHALLELPAAVDEPYPAPVLDDLISRRCRLCARPLPHLVRTLFPILLLPGLIALGYAALVIRSRWLLGRTPLVQLEQDAFAAPIAYVRECRLSGPHADRLVSLARARDVDTLIHEWKQLERELLRAEHATGHRGRPLIMDYLLDYPRTLRELRRRAT